LLENGHYDVDRGTQNRLLVLGEVLWDVFENATLLGGAPLNFSVHAKRLGHDPLLISAVGDDELGDRTVQSISRLGLRADFVQRTSKFKTGTARVELGPGGGTHFLISRPAAYDYVRVSGEQLNLLKIWSPEWFYYGTLFSAVRRGKSVLRQLLDAIPAGFRFYDLNLRPGYDSPTLVAELLTIADIVKLNEEEREAVRKFTGLPSGLEAFCREGSKRYGWKAACVTLGSRGCAMLCEDEYVEAAAPAVKVADPVGAGDAFAAAFVHGLIRQWPAAGIATFANRVGALVASRHGAIPDWTLQETMEL
jgi:fructokinase